MNEINKKTWNEIGGYWVYKIKRCSCCRVIKDNKNICKNENCIQCIEEVEK